MKAKQIYNYIQYLNPKQSIISSLGTYISNSSEIISNSYHKEIIGYIHVDSLAWKIITSTKGNYTEKQLWIIAFELEKNEEFCSKLEKEIAKNNAEMEEKKQSSNAKLKANKENSSDIISQVKSAGRKLGDYYSFVKSNKKFAKEFYSKKFTQESVNAFLGL